MKNSTLQNIGIAALLVVGLSFSAVGPTSLSAAQYPRQTQSTPRSAPIPTPRPVQEPAQRQAPAPPPQRQAAPEPQRPSAPQYQPQRSSQPAPEIQNHQEVQRQQQNQARQQQEQQRQQQEALQRQQQQEQARQQQALQRQQQEQARQEKQAREAAQKRQEQQARELKQQQKLQEKQQKEQARQQKEMEKLQKKQGISASNSARSNSSEASKVNSASNSSVSKSAAGDSMLSHESSRSVVDKLNASRAGMTGINHKPLPAGDVTVHSNGSMSIKVSSGRELGVRANGTIASVSASGKSATFNSKGKLTSAHTKDMSIRRDAHGKRIVVSRRPDHTIVVATGRHNGYIQRAFQRDNRVYVQRTIVRDNRIVTRTYVVYNYRGVALPHFVAPVYYSPAFYAWVFYPWAVPVRYSWVWFGAPWYVGPNTYFVAYASYPAANYWLTDYYLGQTMSAAYQEQQDDLADSADDSGLSADGSSDAGVDDFDNLRASVTTPITPELKAAIAEEVREQLEAENTDAAHPEKITSQGELPSVLTKTNYIFVVADTLDVTTADQQGCALQAGDTLALAMPPSDGSSLAQLRVTSSRKLDCPAGVQVLVSQQDLEDMQNNFRSQIDSGLAALQNNQGKDGLPAAPAEALAVPKHLGTSGIEPISSAGAVSTLDTESRQADTLELEMTESVGSGL